MNKTSSELWAVVDKETHEVVWTRGGSSSSQRLMVYESEDKAKKALNNYWIKLVHGDAERLSVVKIYSAEFKQWVTKVQEANETNKN